MEDKHILALTGIICMTLLEALAVYRGINGVYFSAVIGGIGVIVGFAFGFKFTKAEPVESTTEP